MQSTGKNFMTLYVWVSTFYMKIQLLLGLTWLAGYFCVHIPSVRIRALPVMSGCSRVPSLFICWLFVNVGLSGSPS